MIAPRTPRRESPSFDIGDALSPHHVTEVALGRARVHVSPATRERLHRSHARLARFVEERRRIYGVTTGYGPLASHPVTPEHAAQLQQNLVYHLCSGVGAPLSVTHTRATMVARAASLARGYSGIGDTVFDTLLACLEHDLVPVVPEMGTVGASGDLTPLAHIALALMGEGQMWHDGQILPSHTVLAEHGLAPVTLGHKEGLALVNGTSCMTGIAAVNHVRTERALSLAVGLTAGFAEALGGRLEAWHPLFAEARPHPGQQWATEALGRWADGTSRLRPVPTQQPILDETHAVDGWLPEGELPQDPYTVRCAPQLFGAVHDLLRFHGDTVRTELASATDNPLIDVDEDLLLHGGNFYGQHVAFASDTLLLGVAKLAIHAERALARLTDRALNNGLPSFLHAGHDGVNSGFMGAQVTASALVAEIRTRAVPASIQSVPTNANNQDVVTMGTIAARKTAGVIDLLYRVLAIQALAVAQAVEQRTQLDAFSPATRALVSWVRGVARPLTGDRPLSPDIERVAHALEQVDWTLWPTCNASDFAWQAASDTITPQRRDRRPIPAGVH